jgi:hypothetical protein
MSQSCSMEILKPALPPAEDVNEAIIRVAAMNVSELRSAWRGTFASAPPSAFSRDLLARAIAYRLQEEAYGGLSASTARLLRSLAKPGTEAPRQLKVGCIIVREHKGVLHEVMVTPQGFCWEGQTFDSLSTIARTITGVSWNGPRFFGLRSKQDQPGEGGQASAVDAPPATKAGRSSTRTKSVRSGRRSSIRTGVRP